LPRFDGYSAILVIIEDAAAMRDQKSGESPLYGAGIADDKNDMAKKAGFFPADWFRRTLTR